MHLTSPIFHISRMSADLNLGPPEGTLTCQDARRPRWRGRLNPNCGPAQSKLTYLSAPLARKAGYWPFEASSCQSIASWKAFCLRSSISC